MSILLSALPLFGILCTLYFELEDQGQVIGGFYFDLYARTGKRGGAWMSGFRSRMPIGTRFTKTNLLYGV